MTMPIYEMLKAYGNSKPLPFHMPGHLMGKGLPDALKKAGCLDITEIPGSDNLHAPEGVIKASQELAAKCFGAGYSIFLVNGSTSGIHAMIQAVVKPGGKLIIGRDCHKSVLNALAMLNADPVFVMPAIDQENQIPLGITAQDIERAILAHPDAQGILLTRPNYYGIASNFENMVCLAQKHKIPLLVDEAHGAHYRFHKLFPRSAVELGADLCVQSLHKTLPALTQTALLHGNEGFVDKKTVEAAASMVQTTSPSYLLMASIDMARDMMENEGESLYESLRLNLERFDRELSARTVIRRIVTSYKGFDSDFSRIVLSFGLTSLSGFEAARILQEGYGIVAEMSDLKHVVFIATPFHEGSDFDKLLLALEELSRQYKTDKLIKTDDLCPWDLPERVMSLREAMFSRKLIVPINEARGAICAQPLIPYPPCIPVLNPGEIISESAIAYIKTVIAMGSSVHGIDEGKIHIVNTKD